MLSLGATTEAVEDDNLVGLRHAGGQTLNKDRFPDATLGMNENRNSRSGDPVACLAQLLARHNLSNIDETRIGWEQVFRLAAQRDEDILALNKIIVLASWTSLLAYKFGEIEDTRFRAQVGASRPINNCAPKPTVLGWQCHFGCTEFTTPEETLRVHRPLSTKPF
jgi:hypothetical protein